MNVSLFKRVSQMRFGGANQRTRDIKEFYDTATKPGQAPIAGRAWSASELRQKSFSDLHKLWFVLLKEKNMLLTERLHARSTHRSTFRNPMRLKKVKLGMARIKVVLSERNHAYQVAKKQLRTVYEAARQQDNTARRLARIEEARLALEQKKQQEAAAELSAKAITQGTEVVTEAAPEQTAAQSVPTPQL